MVDKVGGPETQQRNNQDVWLSGVKETLAGMHRLEQQRQIDAHQDRAWQAKLFEYKNSAVCGHLLVGWAMIANLLAFFLLHDRATIFGVAFSMFAVLLAWALPTLNGDAQKYARIGAAVFTGLAWTATLLWASRGL